MRVLALALLAAAAAPALALAQGWSEGVAALVPVDAYAAPTDRGVWTDMRPLSFKGSDEELQAVVGATLFAGPAPGSSLSVEAWHGRYVEAGRVDCENPATLCVVHVRGRGDREALVFPVRANVHGLPQSRMRAVPRLRVSDPQRGVLVDWLLELLVLGDGNTLTSSDPDTRLFSTHPARPDCGDPAVTCGVVFEIETSVSRLALSLL